MASLHIPSPSPFRCRLASYATILTCGMVRSSAPPRRGRCWLRLPRRRCWTAARPSRAHMKSPSARSRAGWLCAAGRPASLSSRFMSRQANRSGPHTHTHTSRRRALPCYAKCSDDPRPSRVPDTMCIVTPCAVCVVCTDCVRTACKLAMCPGRDVVYCELVFHTVSTFLHKVGGIVFAGGWRRLKREPHPKCGSSSQACSPCCCC